MMNLNEVLIRPLITEKNTMLSALGQYTFEVDRRANKPLGKEAVEKIFKVDVTAVNVINVPPKTRRVGRSTGKTSPWKKAVVTLKPGQRIEVFEGV
jgi:large subunit ribosomal protein L23